MRDGRPHMRADAAFQTAHGRIAQGFWHAFLMTLPTPLRMGRGLPCRFCLAAQVVDHRTCGVQGVSVVPEWAFVSLFAFRNGRLEFHKVALVECLKRSPRLDEQTHCHSPSTADTRPSPI